MCIFRHVHYMCVRVCMCACMRMCVHVCTHIYTYYLSIGHNTVSLSKTPIHDLGQFQTIFSTVFPNLVRAQQGGGVGGCKRIPGQYTEVKLCHKMSTDVHSDGTTGPRRRYSGHRKNLRVIMPKWCAPQVPNSQSWFCRPVKPSSRKADPFTQFGHRTHSVSSY